MGCSDRGPAAEAAAALSPFDAEPVLQTLKPFQRDTVEHVVNRFYRDLKPTRRFLVADETGLGKSVVAKGVIARVVERLQDVDSVRRIDIVYVCSNTDIARQNLGRLQVVEGEHLTLSSRLTLLAKDSRQLAKESASGHKPVNLVAFTPGTSFAKGHRTGKAEERALLFLIVQKVLNLDPRQCKAALRMLRGNVRVQSTFNQQVRRLQDELCGEVDPAIVREFRKLLTATLKARVRGCLSDIGGKEKLSVSLATAARDTTAALRSVLARASVKTLKPDLVILDEFQRFRHLLDLESGGDSADLAHHLFDYGNAKVLLLSATPYKPYTLAEEQSVGDDHAKDLQFLLEFLESDPKWRTDIAKGFQEYREALVAGAESLTKRRALRELLLQAMCRTERPALGQVDMLREVNQTAEPVTAGDLRGWIALSEVARQLGARATLDYWKSAPYFVNFMEMYQLGGELRTALKDVKQRDAVLTVLRRTQFIQPQDVRQFKKIDAGSGRLRQVAKRTVDQDWWRLLWMPPSMPYCQLQAPFRRLADIGMTKQLVFSSWTATPTAVAALLSYEADRKIAKSSGDAKNTRAVRATTGGRLEYRIDGGSPGSMSTIALFLPHPRLASATDPLSQARRVPDRRLTLPQLRNGLRTQLRHLIPASMTSIKFSGAVEPWRAFTSFPGAIPEGLDQDSAAQAMAGRRLEDDARDDSGYRGLDIHVQAVFDAAGSATSAGRRIPDILDDLLLLGMAGPGNVAWRSLGRLLSGSHRVTPAGHWKAAALVANGIRSLFNRGETQNLLDGLRLDGTYWRAVLHYCQAGDLQAVLDEYLHHLRSAGSGQTLDDESLWILANEVRDVLALRPSTYRAFDPFGDKPIPFLSRFALRYGGGSQGDNADNARAPEVRQAFNSPFWPFVLTTTSAGQEGIDFHWWCSSVTHWNIPANPVDFEQREGRVHRFGGHAIRRNVAQHHRSDAMTSDELDPWKAAYDAAITGAQTDGFAPYWVYPGDAKVERVLLPYPLSRDVPRAENLKASLALYRLAFGQPRQEDLVQLVRRQGVTADNESLDLRPPKRTTVTSAGVVCEAGSA